jgi:uncharacterized membrane protein YdjX (TVP38/TMEM64 family)
MESFILYILIAIVIGFIIGFIMGRKSGKKSVIKKVENYVKKEKINIDMEKIFKPKQGKVIKEDFFEIPSE